MGARQKDWARRARIRLTLALGGVCQVCGEANNLTFDCLVARGGAHHRFDTSARMSFYHREARAGNVALLCHFCNSCKADLNRSDYESAVQFVRQSESLLSQSGTPGGEHAMTPAVRRECWKEITSRIRANVSSTGVISPDYLLEDYTC